MRFNSILLYISLFAGACQHDLRRQEKQKESLVQRRLVIEEKNKFPAIKFDAKKDLACGMPLAAGIEDTAHYKGKVYGFCSKECKDDFLKNPEGFVVLTDRIN